MLWARQPPPYEARRFHRRLTKYEQMRTAIKKTILSHGAVELPRVSDQRGPKPSLIFHQIRRHARRIWLSPKGRASPSDGESVPAYGFRPETPQRFRKPARSMAKERCLADFLCRAGLPALYQPARPSCLACFSTSASYSAAHSSGVRRPPMASMQICGELGPLTEVMNSSAGAVLPASK